MKRYLAAIALNLFLIVGVSASDAFAQPAFPTAQPSQTETSGARTPSVTGGVSSPSATRGAQTPGGFSLKRIVDEIVVPAGDIVIQLLYALAFVFFLYGIVRLYFAEDDKQRAAGKQYAIWGIVGLAVLFAVWGIVNVLLQILTEFAA